MGKVCRNEWVIHDDYYVLLTCEPTQLTKTRGSATILKVRCDLTIQIVMVVERSRSMSVGKMIANNKKAYYEYFIEDKFEAGIVLAGTEVKSIRMGKVNIKESYAQVKDGEVFIHGMHISPYEMGNRFNRDPLRVRKLLLHKREISRLIGYIQQKGLTLVPLKIYINPKGLVKVEIGVGRGKKMHDKRDSIAKRDSERRIAQALKDRY